MEYVKVKSKQNNGIQLLRGIACIFVVLCHTKFTNTGSWGVDIFFVISGFMLMYSTRNDRTHFFLKRIKKIIPLYWFMTIVTSLLICVAPSLFNSYEFKWEYLLKSLFFIPYQHSGIDQPIYGLGWTLNYEVFIYLIFGISMCFSHKYRAMITSIICIILTIGGGILQVYFINYYSNSVLMEFVAGMVLYYVMNKFTDGINLYLCEGIVLVSFILFIFAGSVSRYFNIVFASIAFIGAWKMEESLCINNIVVKILVSIGNASYYIYLTHIYVVRIVEKVLSTLPVLIQAVIVVICACALGVSMRYCLAKKHNMNLKTKLNIKEKV